MTLGRLRKQRGYVLIIMGATLLAMIGALGLAVDLGRVFIIKNETQHFVDAAALAAAIQLDGTSSGITNATTAATGMADKWNFGTTTVSSPTVEFGTTSNGTCADVSSWTNNPGNPDGYLCVRVKSSVSASLYFIPIVTTSSTKNYKQTVNSQAIAGQIALTTLNTGLSPYTGIVQDNTVDTLGLAVGGEYMIQQAGCCTGGSGANTCSSNKPWNCFNGNLCNDDSTKALWQVASVWSSSTSGYWGYQANNLIRAAILDLIQLQAVSVCPWATFSSNALNCDSSTNIYPSLSSGQKQQQAIDLDLRSNQDTYILTASGNGNSSQGNGNGNFKRHFAVDPATTYTNYMAAVQSGASNKRRLLTAPVVWPVDTTHSIVAGYGYFILETNISSGTGTSSYYQSTTNGNDGFCAIYAGPAILGAGVSAAGKPGAYTIQLVQ